VSRLHAERAGDGPTLVLLHGFTQTGRLWGRFGELLGRGRRLVAIDLPGHGDSSEVRADLAAAAGLVADAAGPGPFALLGYSLGARLALHVAVAAPAGLTRLVLLSGTAGIEDDDARGRRRREDEDRARGLESAADVGAFLDSWLAAPMFATLRTSAAGEAERRRNSPAGLASSLLLAGAGAQVPLWDRLGEVAVPVLVVAGATDPRYQALGARLARGVPDGTLAVVPGAGHAVHLEQPEVTAAVVSAWLADNEPPG
jgi:2-succinyl-6-hydroxy-2,4-cyclohexadiene-1-carboxylate synthase